MLGVGSCLSCSKHNFALQKMAMYKGKRIGKGAFFLLLFVGYAVSCLRRLNG